MLFTYSCLILKHHHHDHLEVHTKKTPVKDRYIIYLDDLIKYKIFGDNLGENA